MANTPEKETVACKNCGYEFLYHNHDPCPKCGSKLKMFTIELETAPIRVSASSEITTQKEIKKTHHRVELFSIGISIGSAIVCYFIDPLFGLIVGLLVFVFTYYLGKKYAEKRIIERDHYH
ncbi:MAG: hypothetical protein WC367_03935 [Methanoregula sp.]|jgi:RNA polymerase subunit RPABC4/transcription elongation factor Spt4